MGKVVGGGEDQGDKVGGEEKQPNPSETSGQGPERETDAGRGHKGDKDKTLAKGKKKTKMIKLSFGDDEG